jgi:GT2 family glycosyltransferase
MVTPTVLDYADPTRIDRQGIVLTRGGLAYERTGEHDGPLLCPDGCAALYSRALLNAVCCSGRYFDEDLFAYGEDVDLGIRALRKGFRAGLAERGIVYHKGGASLGGMDSSESLYLRHRNTIWIILKDLPAKTLLRNAGWIALGQLGTLARGLTGAGRGVVLRGKIDGFKGVRAAWAKRRTSGGDIEDLPMVPRVFLPGRRRPQALHRNPGAIQSGRA